MLKKILLNTSYTILLQGTLMSATINDLKYNDTKIPVIFEKDNALPIFNLQLIFQNSGYIKDKKLSGLTNLTAKLLNEGTKKDGAITFARKLENQAISIDTSCGFETFVIEISCLKEEYKNSLKYLKELLKDPNIKNKTVSKIKNLEISKLKQKDNDFDYIASNNLKSIIYKDTLLANPKSGKIETIKQITKKDIQNRLNDILNINNLIIATGGDIKYKNIKKDIKDILEILNQKSISKIKRIPFNISSKEIISKKDTQQSYIYFASPFKLDVNSKDNYKMKVASFILGGSGFGSRLMEEIRVKHGLAYSAYGNIINHKSHSYFTGYLQTKIENTEKAKNMVVDIVNEFIKNGITQDELKSAKKFLEGSEPLRTETFSQRLGRASNLYYKGLDLDYPKKELELIDKLTRDELNEFIKSHMELKELSFSIVTK